MWVSLMTADSGYNNAGPGFPTVWIAPVARTSGRRVYLTGLPSMLPSYRVERSEPTMDKGSREALNQRVAASAEPSADIAPTDTSPSPMLSSGRRIVSGHLQAKTMVPMTSGIRLTSAVVAMEGIAAAATTTAIINTPPALVIAAA